jgi:trimeric autotransporter adhesin
VDNAGVLYIADSYNCKVRKITADGYISVAAGATTCATSTSTYNGGARTPIDRPAALAYDSVSNLLYITMPRVYRVLRFDMNAARITPFLGNGRTGVTETTVPTSLTLNEPSSVFVGLDGALFVTAIDSFQAYQVKEGKVATIAGRWPQPSEYPAPEETMLMRPQGLLLAPDAGDRLLVADAGAGRILRLDQTQAAIEAVAGLAYPSGFDRGTAGPALEATLREPVHIIAGPEGDLYFSERTRIRAINQSGVVRTILDSLDQPFGLAFDGEGRLWYSEAGTHRIMRLDAGSKTPTVMAGTEDSAGFFGDDGAATSALLNTPGDIVFDSSGNLLIADRGNYRVRLISPDGKIRTIAGSGLTFNYSNMTGLPATETGFGVIEGIALGADGSLYIS